MKPAVNRILLLAATLLGTAAGARSGQGEAPIEGRITGHSGDRVEVCFNDATRLEVGDEFDVVRHTILTYPKGATGMRSENVGTIRVIGLAAGHCATASMTGGSARAQYWVTPRRRS